MYLNILKKDLKRKRTMNIILLLFIILAVMFVSSSANNLSAVTSSLDTYFDNAGVADYCIFTSEKVETDKSKNAEEIVRNFSGTESYKSEDSIYISTSGAKQNDKKIKSSNTMMMNAFENACITYYDDNNDPITEVNDGELYLRKSIMTQNDLSVGDKITITVGNVSKDFTIKDILKDAVLGSSMMGTPRFLISKDDFNDFYSNESVKPWLGKSIYVNTHDVDGLEQALSDCTNITFMGSKALIKTTYIMDMINAGVLLIVSICLILISFVILRFTITFTLSEEYREIGIMKAIGIKNRKIRGLYIVKYLATSIVGAIIGLIISIPFGNMLLQQVSENIVIEGNNRYILNIIFAIAIVLIIMLFCYRCTGKVKKFSPVDAIRNGTTGERFKKKGVIKLSKSKLKPVPFMAVNDILSGVKRFGIMLITFTIGILLITIMVNTIATLQSDNLITWYSMTKSDVFLEDLKSDEMHLVTGGHENLKEQLNEIKKTLSENEIKADCYCETAFKLGIINGDYKCKSLAFQGTNTTTDMYSYLEGTPPKNKNEIALTYITADKIHAKIGDTVTISTVSGDKDYIITAIYQSMNNMGEGIRFTEDEELDYSQAMGIFPYQVKYTDNPSSDEISKRFELIKDKFSDYTVRTCGEYVDYMIGGVAGYMSNTKLLIILIVLIINILVAVLMEKSFLTKERSEIAMLKAIGFKNSSIILWQTLRIGIVMVLAVFIAILLSEPASQLSVGFIFKIMGANNIIFDVNVLESYVIYPLICLATTVLAVFIVAQQVRKVKSSEINSIE